MGVKRSPVTSWLDSREWEKPMIPRNSVARSEGFKSLLALVASIVMMAMVGGLALVLVSLLGCDTPAFAQPMVRFEVCSIVDGETKKPKDGEPGTVIWIAPEAISSISEITGSSCTTLRTVSGSAVFVKGSASNIRCLLKGGAECENERRH